MSATPDMSRAFLRSRRTGDALAIGVVSCFLIWSVVRLLPFSNGLDGILRDTGNDWSAYAADALDVRHHGILMPSIHGPYVSPASFLYIYFLAACFALFGESSVPVFLVQSLLLGLSVALAYWTFRDKMTGLTGVLFLATASVFAAVDVSKYYSFRFLGENLALFTLALFFYCFIRGLDRNKPALMLTAAAVLGLSVLIRPNLVLLALVVVLIAIWHYRATSPAWLAWMKSLLFTAVLASSMSLLLIRNHVVAGGWLFLPAQGSSVGFLKLVHPVPPSVDLSGLETHALYARLHVSRDVATYVEFARQQPRLFFGYFLKKAAFCLGFLPILEPDYQYRPHWMLMWAGCFAYLWRRLKDAGTLETWELTVLLFIPCYYGVIVLAAAVGNYGFRMLIPATNIVLACAFLAVGPARRPRTIDRP